MIKNWEKLPEYNFNQELNRKELIGGSLENAELQSFEVNGRIKEGFPDILIQDFVFKKIQIKYAFFLWGGAHFKNVVFDSIKNIELYIAPFNVLDNVVIKGSRLKRLIVNPFTSTMADVSKPWTVKENESIDCMLDISELNAKEVDIRGIPHKKMKWNPEKHVVYLENANEKLDLKKLNFYSRDAFRYAGSYPGDCYVVSYPHPKDKDYAELVDEIAMLREIGVAL